MLTPTHLVTGQTAFLLAAAFAGHDPTPAQAATAAFASVIPDLDSRQSYLGRLVPFLSGPVEYQFGHRALSHSLLAPAVLGYAAWLLLPFGFFLALIAGWVAHSVADMMTPSGVAWFWPSRVRCVMPGNVRYRMESMSRGELGFLVVMALTGLLLLPLARTGEGATGLIRSAIGDLDAARAEYDAGKGTHAFTLEVQGRDNRTYGDIAGTYPVIGPFREAGFILETEAGPRSLCRGSGCDWYADRAVLIRGEPEQTTTFEIRAQTASTGTLLTSLARLEAAGKEYLLGALQAQGVRPEPPTVETSGETARLSYAEPSALRHWGRRQLRNLELTVQVRHPPGESVPEPAILREGSRGMHPLLEKWVKRLK